MGTLTFRVARVPFVLENCSPEQVSNLVLKLIQLNYFPWLFVPKGQRKLTKWMWREILDGNSESETDN